MKNEPKTRVVPLSQLGEGRVEGKVMGAESEATCDNALDALDSRERAGFARGLGEITHSHGTVSDGHGHTTSTYILAELVAWQVKSKSVFVRRR